MSIESYRELIALLPEPTLILSGEGIILAANEGVANRLGMDPAQLHGKCLSDVVTNPPEELAAYLRSCSRTRQRVIGALDFPKDAGKEVSCRAEGAVIRPRSEAEPALILLRLSCKEDSNPFLALNQRIEELNREIATRKQVEEELRAQREWLRVSLTSIGDAVITTDINGRVSFLNPVAETLTGWRQADAAGRPLEDVFNIVNEGTRAVVENPVTQVLREGNIVGLANHTLLIARDGTENAIEDTAAPIKDEGGQLRGVVLVFHDVTARRRGEKHASAQHATARILAESATLQEAIPRILEAVCEHLGWDVAALWTVDERANVLRPGGVWHSPTLHAPEFEADAKERTFAPGTGLPGRVWAAARPVWLEDVTDDIGFPRASLATRCGLHGAFGTPILLRGEVLGVLEFFSRDVRPPEDDLLEAIGAIGRQIGQFFERSRAEGELRESEARKAAILETALDCIISIDHGDRVIDWNPAAERTFGYSRAEVMGRPMVDLIVPARLREGHNAGLSRYLRTGEGPLLGRRVEIAALRADGSEFPVELSIVPIPQGTAPVFTAYLRDISERKRAEQVLAERVRLAGLSADIGTAVSSGSSLRAVLQQCAEALVRHLDAAFARIWALNDAEDVLELRSSAGLYTHLDGPHSRVPVGRLKIGLIARERKPHLTNDVPNDPRISDREWAKREGMVAFAGYPLIVEEQVIGVLALFARHPLAANTLETLGSVADRIAHYMERKRSEEAARAAEENTRLIIESVKDYAIFSLDLAGNIATWNTGAEQVFGYSEAEVIGQSAAILFTPEDRAAGKPEEELRTAAETGRAEDERWHLRNDGSRFFASGMVTPIYDDAGTLRGYTKVARDITERKRAEERFRFLAESMPQKIFTAKPSGDIDYFNRQWTEFTGLSFEQIKDWGWTQFIHPEDLEENVRRWRCSIDTGEPFQFEHRFRRADGAYRWHLSRAQAMRDPRGNVLMWIGSNTDIDDVKRAEEALREADRRKDEFLAMLAHELRNPLASINNAVHFFGRAEAEADLEWAKEVVERQVKHLARLIDDLLDVSRITRGKILLRKEPLDLAPVLTSAVEAVRPLIEERKHELTVSLAPGALRLEADPLRLEQILVNLLTNAAKYTEAGGRIWLTAGHVGKEIVIRVRDTGLGITPELLPRMFELFAQGDRSIARSEGGLGIGLTLVRKLVEMHGGEVTAASEGPGQGSEFTVRLPAWEEPAAERPQAKTTSPRAARQGSRVLVVDDNVDTARGLAKLLRLMGHDIRTAHDGPTAIEAARSHRPGIVLLDIGLPGMDGYQVAEQLREEDCCKDALLIAITGYGQEEDRHRSKAAGFDHHLVKPVDYSALVSLISQPA